MGYIKLHKNEVCKFARYTIWRIARKPRIFFYVDAGVTKFFWGDRMSVKLSGTDLFHGMKSGNRMYYNRASSLQINNYDSRKVMLTVRYKFNATRNKYKGSGAGESEKERL